MQDVKQIRVQQALIVAGLAGVVAVFLPFTENISPFDTLYGLDDHLWQLGLPFFLALPITAASLRLLLSATLSTAEKIFAYVMSIGAIIIFFPVFEEYFEEFLSFEVQYAIEFVPIALYCVVLIVGLAYLVVGLKSRNLGKHAPVTAMQIVYIAHCSFLLTVFYFDSWLQAGAYLTLFTAVVYLVQILSYHMCRRFVR